MAFSYKKIDNYVPFIIAFFTLIALIYGFINCVKISIIDFDSGINATACLNLIKNNEFRPGFFKTNICDVFISTGLPVLLPTFILYNLFGVNSVTTYLMPFIYFIASYLALLFIGFNIFNNMKSVYTLLISIVIQDTVLWYVAIHLLGEIGSIFFILLSICIIIKYYKSLDDKNCKLMMLIFGICLGLSISCKLLSILFVGTELIIFGAWYLLYMKKNAIKLVWIFVGGAIVLFFCLMFRYFQLHSIPLAIKNIILYVEEMFSQGKQFNPTAIVNNSIIERAFYELQIFICDFSRFFVCHPLIIIILPYIILFVNIYRRIFDIKTLITAIIGIGGGAIFIYYILFAPVSLNYRRCIVYSFMTRYSFILILCIVINELIAILHNVDSLKKIAIIFTIFLICNSNLNWYDISRNISRFSASDSKIIYEYTTYKSLNAEINELKKQGAFFVYLYGYNVPFIDLYSSYEMEPINDIETFNKILNRSFNNCYFVIGNLWPENLTIDDISKLFNIKFEKVSKTEVDGEMIPSDLPLDKNQFLYSIYKMSFN